MPDGWVPVPPDVSPKRWGSSLAMVAEGVCPYGHRLQVVELHGRQVGSCMACRCSWYTVAGKLWGACCVPGDHTCRDPANPWPSSTAEPGHGAQTVRDGSRMRRLT